MPILYVSHDYDDEEGNLWQFHCGNGDYSPDQMQLVKLETILRIDPTVCEVTVLLPGYCAKRIAPGQPWQIAEE
jgi:hypothetical protein